MARVSAAQAVLTFKIQRKFVEGSLAWQYEKEHSKDEILEQYLNTVYFGANAYGAEAAAKTDIGWGHQIRSYVLQPYQLVKDLRTGVTSTSPGDVLDGDLDPFMAAALSQRVTGEKVQVEDVD